MAGLLRGCAEEIGLDLDREYDLVAVAQYYLNLHTNNRAGLSQVLRDEFDRHGVYTENHELIGRLPVPTVWTTNFDTLLEQGYARAGRGGRRHHGLRAAHVEGGALVGRRSGDERLGRRPRDLRGSRLRPGPSQGRRGQGQA